MIEFGCGEDIHSIDQKITLKVDTGADVNAINKTTFQRLFPNKKLNPSTVILENFDSTCIKPMGGFKCFLRWKGKKYRVDIEVMDLDTTPNVLSRESTFVMGILKPCFVLKKEGKQIPMQILKVNNPTPTKQVEGHSSKNSTTSRSARSMPPYNLNGKVDLSRPLTEGYIKSEYSDIFEGLGWFPGEPYRLKLKLDSTPAKQWPRKIPAHLEEAFHEEIN